MYGWAVKRNIKGTFIFFLSTVLMYPAHNFSSSLCISLSLVCLSPLVSSLCLIQSLILSFSLFHFLSLFLPLFPSVSLSPWLRPCVLIQFWWVNYLSSGLWHPDTSKPPFYIKKREREREREKERKREIESSLLYSETWPRLEAGPWPNIYNH